MRRLLVLAALVTACGGGGARSAEAPPPSQALDVPPMKTDACNDDAGGPELPAIPELPNLPKKDGDAFTVFGAVHALRSRFESESVTKGEIAIVGWIVDSNVARAPKCAWHKTGKADPDGCVTELPAFVIADTKDAKPDDPNVAHIKVLGWARNFAAVFDATAKYQGLKARPKELHRDEVWAVDVPYPIPQAGTKVRVKGRYGFTFTKSSTGIVADPKNGIMTYASLDVLP